MSFRFIHAFSPTTRHLRPMLSQLRSMFSTRAQTNAHFSVDSNGKHVVDLTFVEEPLGLPASDGYGWPYLDFGEAIGPEERYVVRSKLGWGQSASIWLAHDQKDQKFVAIKVLTGSSTPLALSGHRFECHAQKWLLRHNDFAAHCLIAKAQFTMRGKGSAGSHYCFVTDICGQNLMALQDNAENQRFSLPDTKHILLHVLRGIAHSHRCGVIHTDIKPDNILVSADYSTDAINAALLSDPPRRHPVETSVDGDVEVAVSQPLILPQNQDIRSSRFVLADFGSAWPLYRQNHDPRQITAPAYRAPEIILGQPWNEKVDIWSFGCLVFELIIGPPLFQVKRHEELNLEPFESVLNQMMTYIGERFNPDYLQKNQRYHEYFDDNGVLLKNPAPVEWSLEKSIRAYPFLSEEDIRPTVRFIKRCLRLHPGDRASAEALLEDPWFSGVE